MKRKNLSKFVALAMVGAMMIVPIPAAAADVDSEDAAQGTTTGTGDVEGIVNKDVFKVELPTIGDGDTTFNFILDPQGLITDTAGKAYEDENATFDSNAKGLYFANPKDDNTVEYKASSPSLTAKNKGTTDVDVTLTATAKALSGTGYTIGLSQNDAFSGDRSTSVYLAMVSRGQTAALTNSGAKITDTLNAAPANAYEVTYNDTDGIYEYGLTTAAQAADYNGFDSLDFNLVGACNTTADWAAAKDAAPTVDVAWELERHYVVPVFDGSGNISISYKGTNPTAGNLTFTKPDGTTWAPPATVYDANINIRTADKKLVLTANWLTTLKNLAGFGIGTYSVRINGKDYRFVIPAPTPTSDGSTDISITYTGDVAPVAGSILFTKPNGTTWTPPATAGGVVVDEATHTITIKATWITTLKNLEGYGTGTYSFDVNGINYDFIIE